jgi:alkanesulfonate monooxygenase SsuD/methylene tetrahydromethanopterin reductase-like flavin-dependent oxidoreductase (luciferase family)
LKSYRDTAESFGYEASDSQLGWAVPIYVADTDERARQEAKKPFELFRNRLLKMPFEMLLPPGYSSRASLKGIMAAKASLTQELTLETAIDMGMVICGSPETVKDSITDYWNDLKFDNLLTMMHFGNLSQELTQNSMQLFAKKVLPQIQALQSQSMVEV